MAIKILPSAFSTDADRLRRFEQEARAAGQLNHPNILTVHDIGTHQTSPYIVCELLEGKTLREAMKGAALPARKAMEYALQILRGLAAAHEKGIVHRDLKPENLFLTQDGRLKILDFGLAKLTRPQSDGSRTDSTESQVGTLSGLVLGTVGYMAPEQARGEPVDHRADLFNFGAILYEMLSGQQAFRGKSNVETLNAIVTEEPSDLAALNPRVSHLPCSESSGTAWRRAHRNATSRLSTLLLISRCSQTSSRLPWLRGSKNPETGTPRLDCCSSAGDCGAGASHCLFSPCTHRDPALHVSLSPPEKMTFPIRTGPGHFP